MIKINDEDCDSFEAIVTAEQAFKAKEVFHQKAVSTEHENWQVSRNKWWEQAHSKYKLDRLFLWAYSVQSKSFHIIGGHSRNDLREILSGEGMPGHALGKKIKDLRFKKSAALAEQNFEDASEFRDEEKTAMKELDDLTSKYYEVTSPQPDRQIE